MEETDEDGPGSLQDGSSPAKHDYGVLPLAAVSHRSLGPEGKGRLYFCAKFAWFFRPVVPFGDLLLIHASTNATDDHKYSPLPSADFDIAEVLVSFSAFIFT